MYFHFPRSNTSLNSSVIFFTRVSFTLNISRDEIIPKNIHIQPRTLSNIIETYISCSRRGKISFQKAFVKRPISWIDLFIISPAIHRRISAVRGTGLRTNQSRRQWLSNHNGRFPNSRSRLVNRSLRRANRPKPRPKFPSSTLALV